MTDPLATTINDKGYLLTGPFVGNFVHVFQMMQFEGSKPEYSIEMIFEPTDPTIAIMQQMLQQKAVEKWGQNIPPGIKFPIRDGNLKAQRYPEFAGKYTVKAADKNRQPAIIDRAQAPILDQNEVYSGAIYRAALDCYAWESSGSYGVNFGLKILQKLDDGKPLSGGKADPAMMPALPPLPGQAQPAMPGMMPQPAQPAIQPQSMPGMTPMQPATAQPVAPQAPMMPNPALQQAQPALVPQQVQVGAPIQPGQFPAPQAPQAPVAQPQGQPAQGQPFAPTGGPVDLNNY